MNNAQNPVKGWSQVYVPYCTGDGHFGTIDSGSVTDYLNGQGSPGTSSVNPGYHFVGFNNMQKIAGHLAATFTGLDQMILTGASAGGLGAVFNATMVEETFGGKVPTTVLIDSAAGFPDVKYMSACLQKNARSTFGWDAALPSDCADCRQPDGSGLINIVKYLHNRYPTDKLGLMMSIHDQIFRLFFGSGMGSDSDAAAGLRHERPEHPRRARARRDQPGEPALSRRALGGGARDAPDDVRLHRRLLVVFHRHRPIPTTRPIR